MVQRYHGPDLLGVRPAKRYVMNLPVPSGPTFDRYPGSTAFIGINFRYVYRCQHLRDEPGMFNHDASFA